MRSSKVKRIYIGLGSNLGDSLANLGKAILLLQQYFQTVVTLSSVYRSEPVELLEQPWFYNQVVALELAEKWPPTAVLRVLKEIEHVMGRKKTVRYGPRLIDLDLLIYKNWILETSQLIVPHPKIEERAFVLYPLVELDPELVNPRTGKKMSEILMEKGPTLSACERVE